MPRSAVLVLGLVGLTVPLLLGRIAQPPPPLFEGDAPAYLRMAQAPPFAAPVCQAPFCWRPLLPWLVRVTPLQAQSGFHLWTLLSLSLLPPVTALFVTTAGGSLRAAFVAGLVLAVGPATAGYLTWDFVRTDGFALLLLVLATWCFMQRWDVRFVLAFVLLSLTKETWTIAAVFAVLWPAPSREGWALATAVVLAITVTCAMRVFVPASEPYTFLDKFRELYWPFNATVVARRLMLASGSTWNVLAPIAAFAIGRRMRDRRAWAIAAAIALASAQVAVAIDTGRIVAAAYPFVLVACVWEFDRLPPRWQWSAGAAVVAVQLPWLLKYARVVDLPLRSIDIVLAVATVACLGVGLARSGSTLPACSPTS